jgi:hypothetical protein
VERLAPVAEIGRAAAGHAPGATYRAYISRRLLDALTLAERATTAEQRATHLLASRYYCALLGLGTLPAKPVRGHPLRLISIKS